MTAIECLRILRNGFIYLVIWNLLLTGVLLIQFSNKQAENLDKQICNLEMIPDSVPSFELIEVE